MTQALSCFDLMPVARNTSTYLHVASCVVAFANIFLLFIFKLTICWLWTCNTNGCHKPEQNMESRESLRKHNNMSLWSYSTLVRRSLVTRSCDLLWVLEDTLGRLLYDVTVLYHTFVRHSWDWRLLWDTFARCSSDSRRHDWQTMA